VDWRQWESEVVEVDEERRSRAKEREEERGETKVSKSRRVSIFFRFGFEGSRAEVENALLTCDPYSSSPSTLSGAENSSATAGSTLPPPNPLSSPSVARNANSAAICLCTTSNCSSEDSTPSNAFAGRGIAQGWRCVDDSPFGDFSFDDRA